jgi:hypothetical protein
MSLARGRKFSSIFEFIFGVGVEKDLGDGVGGKVGRFGWMEFFGVLRLRYAALRMTAGRATAKTKEEADSFATLRNDKQSG